MVWVHSRSVGFRKVYPAFVPFGGRGDFCFLGVEIFDSGEILKPVDPGGKARRRISFTATKLMASFQDDVKVKDPTFRFAKNGAPGAFILPFYALAKRMATEFMQ
jgi:hypothetical protein